MARRLVAVMSIRFCPFRERQGYIQWKLKWDNDRDKVKVTITASKLQIVDDSSSPKSNAAEPQIDEIDAEPQRKLNLVLPSDFRCNIAKFEQA